MGLSDRLFGDRVRTTGSSCPSQARLGAVYCTSENPSGRVPELELSKLLAYVCQRPWRPSAIPGDNERP